GLFFAVARLFQSFRRGIGLGAVAAGLLDDAQRLLARNAVLAHEVGDLVRLPGGDPRPVLLRSFAFVVGHCRLLGLRPAAYGAALTIIACAAIRAPGKRSAPPLVTLACRQPLGAHFRRRAGSRPVRPFTTGALA